MDNPLTISLANLLQNSKNFNFLQQEGMALIRKLAPGTWTDHNFHDPGITLLETLSYALTEAGIQAGADSALDSSEDVYTFMTNLLNGAKQTAPQDFFTCSMVLPSSPVSLTDFQKVLIDNPRIKRAWVSVIEGTPTGNLSVLQQFNPQVNNIISSSVAVSGTAYTINFIFPPWNNPSSRPLQSNIFLQKVSFQNSSNPWQQIANSGIYSAPITVLYVQPGTSDPVFSFSFSVLLQIATPLASAGDLPQILESSANLLALLGDNSDSDVTLLKQYNRRLINSSDRNHDLNSNILSSEVTVSGSPYQIEIAFPYWDDPETAPFQNDVIITNLEFNPNIINPWKSITGTDSYFTFLNFSCNGNPTSWPLVLRIVGTSNELTSSIRDNILTEAANDLITPSTNPLLLKEYNQKVMSAFESSHRIRCYLKNYRNLCETFSAYRSVRIQEVGISAIIEMDAGADIETLLAKIFYSIYQYISPSVIPQSLSALQSQLSTEDIFKGPLLKHGFIQDSLLLSNLPSNTLYVSDIIRLVMQMGTGTDIQTREDEENRAVISVTSVSLSLYLDNRSITTGARDCLQLINSSRHIPQLNLEKCNITVTRNNTVVNYDLSKVLDLYNEQINAANFANVISPDTPSDIPIPIVEPLAMGDYISIQNDLPMTYGVGKAGLPASSSAQRLGQAKQLQGYLFLFEQVLAGYFTQLANINSLFSANPSASTTLYQLPLYNIPAASDLLLPISGYSTWEDFINDENNRYIQFLKTGAETEEQFQSRRHQMLDHLLGRLGEDMQAFSSLIYRQSYSNPLTSSASSALLQFKADYYYALPDLEKNRAQAFGHPAWRKKSLVSINSSPDGSYFLWQILDGNGNILFLQSVPETNKTGAEETAEAAMVLATSESNYTTETDLNGLQRIALRWSTGEQSIAISNKTYTTVTDAENDIPVMQQSVLNLWLKYSLSSLEARLYHLLGLSIKGERRKLINPISSYFDIFDAVVPPPFNKKFRLRSSDDPVSPVLLESQNTYTDVDENTANSKAITEPGGINEMIKYGILHGHFSVDSSFSVSLYDADENIIANSPSSYASSEEAQAAITQIKQLLYRNYSKEGFYIIEHLLLHPLTTGDAELIFPNFPTSCLPVSSSGIPYSLPKDPYSFILTIAFPSGYARDFSDPGPIPLRQETQPDRFRDIEFRQYAEQTIRKFCPAHILPMVVWVDTALAGTTLVDGLNEPYPCFDNLESMYTSWLSAFFTDDAGTSAIAPHRNNLVNVLNRIFAD